ncbi:MAG: hypothetical protein PHG19_09625 [Anaerotignum sp.]|nr:hypothetical protein [Anaerotignum sp.]
MEKTDYQKIIDILKRLDENSCFLVDCLAGGLLAKQELDRQTRKEKAS